MLKSATAFFPLLTAAIGLIIHFTTCKVVASHHLTHKGLPYTQCIVLAKWRMTKCQIGRVAGTAGLMNKKRE